MSIVQIGVIGLICVILIINIRRENPQIAVLLSLAGGLIITFNLMPIFKSIIELITQISEKIDVNFKYISMIIKIVGIAYIAEFCSQICIDAGEGAVASKIELAAKVFIIAASLPVIYGLIQTVNSLLS